MKKLLLSILMVLITSFSFSQITSSDYGSIGDTIYYGTGDASSMNMGSPGIGQVWGFEGIAINGTFPLYYMDPTLLPYSSNFPGANLGIVTQGGLKFMEKTPGYIKQHGDIQGLALKDYSTPLNLLIFPANIGSFYSTSSTTAAISNLGVDTTIFGCVILIDSTQIVGDITLKAHFDATGILSLPTDTFLTTNRVLFTTIKKDSLYIYCPNGISGVACITFGLTAPIGWSLASSNLAALAGSTGGVEDSAKYYAWYAPGEKGEVCTINVNNSTLQPNAASFMIDYATFSAGIEQATFIKSKIYPNPANEFIRLEWNDAFNNAYFRLYSADGKLLSVSAINNAIMVDVRNYSEGNYVYMIVNARGKPISSGKLTIQR
jgi:hypothetical protein